MFDPRCFDLAQLFMADCLDQFPKEKHDALTRLLAGDIQQTIEDFLNADYLDITMGHLKRTEERERERHD